MDLREFVAQCLTSISEGVSQAIEERTHSSSKGGAINPAFNYKGSGGPHFQSRDVEFDIAVTSEDNSAKGGKGSIRVISADISTSSKTVTASRIKFSVPVIFPATEVSSNIELRS
jgi:hypothetical protein